MNDNSREPRSFDDSRPRLPQRGPPRGYSYGSVPEVLSFWWLLVLSLFNPLYCSGLRLSGSIPHHGHRDSLLGHQNHIGHLEVHNIRALRFLTTPRHEILMYLRRLLELGPKKGHITTSPSLARQ